MAARLNKRHQQMVRDKIQASVILDILTKHGMGQLEKPLEASQVRALEIVLRKALPDLSATEWQDATPARTPEEMDDAQLEAAIAEAKGKIAKLG